ncbi:MAG TPA: flagellar biosynthetic protein FliO [Phycisphaerae bacterium]|nr:flagellar biosynthetic protein FliO [Phycisphaerae bacterium]
MKIDGAKWASLTALAGAVVVGIALAAGQSPASGPGTTTSATAPAATQGATTGGGTPLKLLTNSTPLKTADDDGVLSKVIAYALIILVLGGAAMILARRYAPGRALGRSTSIRILESTYLGPRKVLHLVQVGRRHLLLSSTREHVRMLADVTEAAGQAGAGAGEEKGAGGP